MTHNADSGGYPEDMYEHFDPDPSWEPQNVQKACGCGYYKLPDGTFTHFYCSGEHFVFD